MPFYECNKLGSSESPQQIDYEDWIQLTEEEREVGKWYVTNVPGSEPDGTMIFTIATTAWVSNTDSDATDFPYVANISTQLYTNAYIPAETLLLGSNAGAYPTSTEEEAIGLVDKYIQFSTTGIRLRATDAPEVALTLVVRGSAGGGAGGSTNASNVSYDNTNSGLVADDVQEAIDEIADNLDGFKFYPSGTAIVGLVADDSAYKDANGNYVLANSTTGQSMIDNVTYKSIASTEDTRGMVGADSAIPFKKGGTTNLVDINPTRVEGSNYILCSPTSYGATASSHFPCGGYDKLSIRPRAGGYNGTYSFLLDDGTYTTAVSISPGYWSPWVQIPDNAVMVYVTTRSSTDTTSYLYGAFLTKESPYNPDNQ